jgi:hypothetical protein
VAGLPRRRKKWKPRVSKGAALEKQQRQTRRSSAASALPSSNIQTSRSFAVCQILASSSSPRPKGPFLQVVRRTTYPRALSLSLSSSQSSAAENYPLRLPHTRIGNCARGRRWEGWGRGRPATCGDVSSKKPRLWRPLHHSSSHKRQALQSRSALSISYPSGSGPMTRARSPAISEICVPASELLLPPPPTDPSSERIE